MYWQRLPCSALSILSLLGLCGCMPTATDHELDPALARSSLQKAMQAWVDGRKPEELKPEIIVGDPAWNQGRKLVSFEILTQEEMSDGSNLHIPVIRKFGSAGEPRGSGAADVPKVIYIVGTSPVVTIFPQ